MCAERTDFEYMGLLPYAGDIQVAMREHNRMAIRKILTCRRLKEEKGNDLTKQDVLEALREVEYNYFYLLLS